MCQAPDQSLVSIWCRAHDVITEGSCTATHLTSVPWLSRTPLPSSLKVFQYGSKGKERSFRAEWCDVPKFFTVHSLLSTKATFSQNHNYGVAELHLDYASRRQARIAADCISPPNCTRNDLRQSKMQKISWGRAPDPLGSALTMTACLTNWNLLPTGLHSHTNNITSTRKRAL